MELRAKVEYRLVGGGIMLALLLSFAMAHAQDKDVAEKIHSTRATISDAERLQRENMSHLFIINKRIKDIAKKRASLNEKMLAQEGQVRSVAQDVQELEERSEKQKTMLNQRLRRLYQDRKRDSFQWLFSAKTPVEFERNQRFMKRIVDSDHRQLKSYLAQLKILQDKRDELKKMVTELARMHKGVQAQEITLASQMRERSKRVAQLKKVKASKLSELKGLRSKPTDEIDDLNYAFFERKGALRPPVDAPLARDYGTFVDPQFKFRLMHKGLFYSAKAGTPINAIFNGVVALASTVPGYGKTVIVDHGDNYYSVYAFNAKLNVREGSKVREGDVVAVSGGSSPLFGPGLYFEIRHFTDAIDPRHWIKDSVLKTANLPRSLSWDDVSGIAGQ